MKYTTALVAIVVMLTNASIFGQEPGPDLGEEPSQPGPNYKHLQSIEWMIGEWTLVEPVHCETQMIGPAYKWGLNRNVILEQTSVLSRSSPNGFTGLSTIGWDPEKKQIVAYGFDSRGARSESVMTAVAAAVNFSTRTIYPQGETSEREWTLKRIDKDTIVFKVAGQPDQVFKRTSVASSTAKSGSAQQ